MSTSSLPATSRAQQSRLFRIYNSYRLLVSLMLVALMFTDLDMLPLGYLHEGRFQAVTLSYLALNIFVATLLMGGYRPADWHIGLSLLLDILILHLMVFLSGGLDSGITNLVIITVAAGNILAPGRMGFFYAALASLSTLGLAGWMVLSGLDGAESIVRAGFLGLIYFAAAFVLQNISRRLVRSEALAQDRARSIAELEQLNHQIIQRMRTGILVARHNGDIRLANAAATELLQGKEADHPPPAHLPQPLKLRLEQWLNAPNEQQPPFQAGDTTPSVQANFTRLDDSASDSILIFLEDTGKVLQQAQQIKLASLGRLTAGIAHEIRNPLGAISHAAQLLAESPALDSGDRRMTDIIQRHSQRVNAIVENVLELSRRRLATMELLDVGNWLERIIAEYRECRGRDCRIELDIRQQPAKARFDPSQLHQVLTNLMDNGLRYSEKRTGQASLTLRCGLSSDRQRAYIDVIDQGPGLTAEHRQTLFDPFFTTEPGGTGLGLYLARELCEANQSQLTLMDSRAGQCCFRISFSHPEKRSQPLADALPGEGHDAAAETTGKTP
ncbi:MAG: ATP-binding protein [Oleiphilaceae bacterium]|nr:ATP-binding protein [Oleiphilaceae bacterium]